MRRNRRGPGGSGSTTFLSRALRTNEADLKTAFVALGLTMPAGPGDKPVYAEIGQEFWWLNLDSRGGLWINGREKKQGETAAGASNEAMAEAQLESTPGAAASDAVPTPEVAPSVAGSGESRSDAQPIGSQPQPDGSPIASQPVANPPVGAAPEPAPASPAPANLALIAVRLLLKETKTGTFAGKLEGLSAELGQTSEDFVAVLVGAGLRVPEKPREKPVCVEHADEILWLSRNAKGELWLNAKPAKSDDKGGDDEAGDEDAAESESKEAEGDDKKPARRGGRSRKKDA